jgi:hypothetical protein
MTSCRRAALLASAGLVAACASPAPASPFDAWADAFAPDWVRLSPERATFS